VHVGEVARVCMAILDQMSAGAPRHGVFHYCSLGETGLSRLCRGHYGLCLAVRAFRGCSRAYWRI
jgi:hypothetical protein